MFDTLDQIIKHDDAVVISLKERIVKGVVITVLSIALFGGSTSPCTCSNRRIGRPEFADMLERFTLEFFSGRGCYDCLNADNRS